MKFLVADLERQAIDFDEALAPEIGRAHV